MAEETEAVRAFAAHCAPAPATQRASDAGTLFLRSDHAALWRAMKGMVWVADPTAVSRAAWSSWPMLTRVRTLWVLGFFAAMGLAAGCSDAAGGVSAASTYTLCTDASGAGADEVIAQADQLVRDDKMDAAAELYRFRLEETPTDACAARGLAYIAAEPSPDPTGVAAVAAGWDAFFEAWLRPGYRLVVPFLIVLAVLLAVARLVTGIAVSPDRRSWDRQSETGVTRRRLVYGVGVAVLVMTAAWAAIFNSWLTMPSWLRIAFWSVAIVAAGVGVWATALGRGLALRIRIEGRAADGTTTALGSHVLARLQLLGSQRPSGLSVPVQTDVTTLPDDALSVLPQGDLAKGAFRLFQTLGPAVPWHVTVTAVGEGTTAVEISRNGRLVDSTVVTYTLPAAELASAPADVKEIVGAVGAAAFILVTLAERHPTLRIGLCGATRWAGLSAQVLATGVFRGSASLQRKMLASAVENDPGNLAARVALLHVDGRRASDPDGARVYAEGLDGVLGAVTKNRQPDPGRAPTPGWDALLIRGLFNAAVAWMNHYLFETAAAASRPSKHLSLAKARRRVERLGEILAKDYRGLPLRDLAADMRPAGDFLRAAIYAAAGVAPVGYAPPSETGGHHSLTAVYTRACWKAIRAERDETYLKRALDDLATVASMPGFAEWARHDPSFQVFHRQETKTEIRRRYRTIVGLVVPSDFLALPPFAAHADALRNIGVHSADALLQEDPRELAETLGVTVGQSRRWQAVAGLSRVTSAPDGPPLTVAMLFLLLASDVSSVEALRDALSPKRRTALLARLATVAQEHAVTPPTVQGIAQWVLPASPLRRLIDRVPTFGLGGRDR